MSDRTPRRPPPSTPLRNPTLSERTSRTLAPIIANRRALALRGEGLARVEDASALFPEPASPPKPPGSYLRMAPRRMGASYAPRLENDRGGDVAGQDQRRYEASGPPQTPSRPPPTTTPRLGLMSNSARRPRRAFMSPLAAPLNQPSFAPASRWAPPVRRPAALGLAEEEKTVLVEEKGEEGQVAGEGEVEEEKEV
ncbi:hypothetical protein P153DRAFT_361925 [Dothidotthia symphoricarpi CBS 119687]|uniref:Uncharacterized protein n=1 Tax=Dothidotthia symphoricarpi CBS 119687 TaxID=1392245 RepID=A0A6A5ZZ57_9PLEO|nr:uncharacterized protein P153DRAFT_361925 [Dothidotthia symphoricarpi CBS 119687]KAF2123601.1 hypothetical protein P153DRAFT_361925 [Dothidotthia symphoricarpi CBS 119687]